MREPVVARLSPGLVAWAIPITALSVAVLLISSPTSAQVMHLQSDVGNIDGYGIVTHELTVRTQDLQLLYLYARRSYVDQATMLLRDQDGPIKKAIESTRNHFHCGVSGQECAAFFPSSVPPVVMRLSWTQPSASRALVRYRAFLERSVDAEAEGSTLGLALDFELAVEEWAPPPPSSGRDADNRALTFLRVTTKLTGMAQVGNDKLPPVEGIAPPQ